MVVECFAIITSSVIHIYTNNLTEKGLIQKKTIPNNDILSFLSWAKRQYAENDLYIYDATQESCVSIKKQPSLSWLNEYRWKKHRKNNLQKNNQPCNFSIYDHTVYEYISYNEHIARILDKNIHIHQELSNRIFDSKIQNYGITLTMMMSHIMKKTKDFFGLCVILTEFGLYVTFFQNSVLLYYRQWIHDFDGYGTDAIKNIFEQIKQDLKSQSLDQKLYDHPAFFSTTLWEQQEQWEPIFQDYYNNRIWTYDLSQYLNLINDRYVLPHNIQHNNNYIHYLIHYFNQKINKKELFLKKDEPEASLIHRVLSFFKYTNILCFVCIMYCLFKLGMFQNTMNTKHNHLTVLTQKTSQYKERCTDIENKYSITQLKLIQAENDFNNRILRRFNTIDKIIGDNTQVLYIKKNHTTLDLKISFLYSITEYDIVQKIKARLPNAIIKVNFVQLLLTEGPRYEFFISIQE